MKITKEQYEELINGLETRKRDNGDEFIYRKDRLSPEIEKILREVVFERDDHDLDLTYKIVNAALNALSNYEYEEIQEDFDAYEVEGDFASYYAMERLSYLNIWNEEDIASNIVDGSISTACAIWFDSEVRQTIADIINKIK